MVINLFRARLAKMDSTFFPFERPTIFANQIDDLTIESYMGKKLPPLGLADVIICLDDGAKFPAHGVILSMDSSYFTMLFRNGVIKSSPGRNAVECELHNIGRETMRKILLFSYKGAEFVDLEDVNDAVSFFEAADFLCMDEALAVAREYIMNRVDPRNCIALLKWSNTYLGAYLARDALQKYVWNNFDRVAVENEDVLNWASWEVADILGSDFLHVDGEEVLSEFVDRWVNRDIANRSREYCQLFRRVRLPLVKNPDSLDKMLEHDHIRNCPSCAFAVNSAYTIARQMPGWKQVARSDSLPSWFIIPRYPKQILFAAGGWNGDLPSESILVYDGKADRWNSPPAWEMPEGRAYHGLAILNNALYVVGGYNGNVYFNTASRCNLRTLQWTDIAPMALRRCYISLVVGEGKLYALGGFTSSERLSSAERYDPATNEWTILPCMSHHRSDADAVYYNGSIIMVGGFSGHHCYRDVERFVINESKWTPLPDMNTARSGVSAIACENYIYALGGFNGVDRLRTVERLNMTDTSQGWQYVEPMYSQRSNFAVEVIDGMIYVMGGFDGSSTVKFVECYDPVLNRWYQASDMPREYSGVACAVSDNPEVVAKFAYADRHMLLEEIPENPEDMAQGLLLEGIARELGFNDAPTITIPMPPPPPMHQEQEDTDSNIDMQLAHQEDSDSNTDMELSHQEDYSDFYTDIDEESDWETNMEDHQA